MPCYIDSVEKSNSILSFDKSNRYWLDPKKSHKCIANFHGLNEVARQKKSALTVLTVFCTQNHIWKRTYLSSLGEIFRRASIKTYIAVSIFKINFPKAIYKPVL